MKINHHFLRNLLRTIGIMIFIISVAIKIKQIVLYGGTKNVSNPNDSIEDAPPVNEEHEPEITEYYEDISR